MKIERHYSTKKPEKEGPYKYYGKFVCQTGNSRTNNLVALYAEQYWQRQYGDDYVVSFVPSAEKDEVAFWVNADSKKRIHDFIDYSVGILKKGLIKEHGIKASSIEDIVK